MLLLFLTSIVFYTVTAATEDSQLQLQLGGEGVNSSILREDLLKLGCQATNQDLLLPFLRGYSISCQVATGTHSFTIRNPESNSIAYWSADGSSCAALVNGESASYYSTYSNADGTDSSSITVTGAPCGASPCCLILLCGNVLGCPLNLDYSWTASEQAVGSFLLTIIGSIVGVLVFCICGCVGYCRYRHVCCFKPKLMSIPSMGAPARRASTHTMNSF